MNEKNKNLKLKKIVEKGIPKAKIIGATSVKYKQDPVLKKKFEESKKINEKFSKALMK